APGRAAQTDRLREMRAKQAEAARERQRQEAIRKQTQRLKKAEAERAAEPRGASQAPAVTKQSNDIAEAAPTVKPTKVDPYRDASEGRLTRRLKTQLRQPATIRQL